MVNIQEYIGKQQIDNRASNYVLKYVPFVKVPYGSAYMRNIRWTTGAERVERDNQSKSIQGSDWPAIKTKRGNDMSCECASHKIRKIAGCAWLECQERFTRHRFQWKPVVSDPGMHHGACVTHVPWCMSGSLAGGAGENVHGILGACATRNFTYLARDPWKHSLWWYFYLKKTSQLRYSMIDIVDACEILTHFKSLYNSSRLTSWHRCL